MLRFRFLLAFALTVALAAAVRSAAADPAPLTVEQYKPLPYPKGTAPSPALTLDAIAAAAHALEDTLGGYPPRLKDETERAQVYARWAPLVLAAEDLRTRQGDTEPILVALIVLYRQGHNMDVMGSAQYGVKLLRKALATYPDSVAVNRQAGYFFLLLNPRYAREGEKALLKLRQLLHTDRDPEVERGLMFAYLYENRIEEAKKQAAKCEELRPGDPEIKAIADGLKNGKVGVGTR